MKARHHQDSPSRNRLLKQRPSADYQRHQSENYPKKDFRQNNQLPKEHK